MKSLLNVEHQFEFTLKQCQFQYTIENLGIYSGITNIQFEENSVSFSEEGAMGEGLIPWEKGKLLHFKIENIDANEDSQPIIPKFLRIESKFSKLNESTILFFLAPRVPEAEYDEENENKEEF